MGDQNGSHDRDVRCLAIFPRETFPGKHYIFGKNADIKSNHVVVIERRNWSDLSAYPYDKLKTITWSISFCGRQFSWEVRSVGYYDTAIFTHNMLTEIVDMYQSSPPSIEI